MQIPQLIYGSTDRGNKRGYQLVGRSPSIDEHVATEFCRWAPSHGALQSDDCDAVSLNFFPVNDDRFVVSRSIYGGPEYSGRGGMEVVTIGLVLQRQLLDGYQDNPIKLIQTAISLGHLILPCSFRSSLQPAELPRRGFDYSDESPINVPVTDGDVEQALHLIETGQKVVMLGVSEPERFVDRVFQQRGNQDLSRFSFSTGLHPSASREFQLQFLPAADHIAIRQLESSRQFTCLRARRSIGVA